MQRFRLYLYQRFQRKTGGIKAAGLKLYLEGMGFRAIGRVLEVSNVTVLNWVRAYGQQAEKVLDQQPEKAVKTAELNELHTYIGRKNYCWLWFAVDRERKPFLEVVGGSRGEESGSRLWYFLSKHRLESVKTDYWRAYATFIPRKKHQTSKAETFTVEGYNSLIRHYLARLKRKTKCYSKCENMLLYSIFLFIAKWNKWLSLII